jgi:hypothetical protein
MDESGVTQPDLSKRKVVSLTSCQIPPHCQDARDVTHVYVVATMSLGLGSLPPLFLTVPDVVFKNAELRQLQNEFHTVRTPRGNATIPAMAFSVQHIIAPYTEFLRTRFNNQDLKIYLAMNNQSIHTRTRNPPTVQRVRGYTDLVSTSQHSLFATVELASFQFL